MRALGLIIPWGMRAGGCVAGGTVASGFGALPARLLFSRSPFSWVWSNPSVEHSVAGRVEGYQFLITSHRLEVFHHWTGARRSLCAKRETYSGEPLRWLAFERLGWSFHGECGWAPARLGASTC